jgi:hypothetical protein
MTFRQDSQVPITMFCNWGGTLVIHQFYVLILNLGLDGTLEEIVKPASANRKDLIAWFGTNCGGIGGHSHRANWVAEFMKHIQLDSYGKSF